jgi:hypothetical protein
MIIIFLLWLGMQFYVQPGNEAKYVKQISEFFFIPIILLPELSALITGSLADGLWMMALCLVILSIWEFKISATSISWYVIAILIGISYEVLQSTDFIYGVFDWIDIVAISIGSAIPLIFLFKQSSNAQSN